MTSFRIKKRWYATIHSDESADRKVLDAYFPHSVVTVLCNEGCTLQQAMNCVSELYKDCSRRWYLALADMPIFGEGIDAQMQKYTESCRLRAVGNLHWRYGTYAYGHD